MQALANEFSEKSRLLQQSVASRSRGLQMFRATALGAGITETFQVQIQIGSPEKEEDQVERLQVAGYLTITDVKVLIFREFHVPFEEQTLFHQTVLLENNLELNQTGIHEGSIIYVVRQKRYRSIGASQTTIKTIVLNPAAADGYDLVDVPAPLPPFHLIAQRITFAISYLRRLDRLQQPHTHNKIWVTRQLLEPAVDGTTRRTSRTRRHGPPIKIKDMGAALASLRESLAIACDARTQADIRAIKKWLGLSPVAMSGSHAVVVSIGTVKYFADARVPESALLDVARHITYASFRPGDFVFRQGDSGDVFYVILYGGLSIAGHGAGLFTTLQAGQCFGEVGLFKNLSGHRSASAIVNFDTPVTELCCITRDVYLRSIAMHKQDMLLEYEKLLSECPQFTALSKETLTLFAYAAETLHVEPGNMLLYTGTRIESLYFLARGEVKVTASTVVTVDRPTLDEEDEDMIEENTTIEKRASVMTLRHAPALFGHEACLAVKSPQSQYDVEAVGPCMFLTFSKPTLRRFIMPHVAVMRHLQKDYETRNADIDRRVQQVVAHVLDQDPKPDAEMNALDTFFAHTLSKHDDPKATLFSTAPSTRHHKLSLPHPVAPPKGNNNRLDTPRLPPPSHVVAKHATGFTTAYAALCRNHFHETLPHGDLLTYEQQVHYATKPSTSLTNEEQMAKMNCLIDGLRRMQPVDVHLVDVIRHPAGDQYCFLPVSDDATS
ncbi:Aste57867_22397 [Aphanomyces stellatus]|uniref:Aste57867_22397 protein n=1 Tax=Aphanomyces stellatus TaxID=120398 RepID=A0A485LLC1_9STRA|nr:hypothetical protein As57867_022327 [Aphanomyces stellatus]VFT99060.1 Aste57867_22397 [Aphanomyces stellatus]